MEARLASTIRNFYDGHLKDRHEDPQDPMCLGWTSRDRQEIRFEVLCAAAGVVPAREGWRQRDDAGDPLPFPPAAAPRMSVLDAGCGFGDLRGWLTARGADVRYVGTDMLPKMVETARAKWPAARFDLGNPAELYAPESFDWTLASGFVCVYAGQARVAHLRETAESLLRLSKTGCAFNLLDARTVAQEGALLSYGQDEALAACHGLGAHVALIDGYLDNDFTVVLRRKS